MILFNVLEPEDSYENLELIISKVSKYSQQLSPLHSSILSYSILSYSSNLAQHTTLSIYLPLTTYCVANLIQLHSCFCILNLFSYLLIYLITCSFYCIFSSSFYQLSWPASISTATCGTRALRILCHSQIIKYCYCYCYYSLQSAFCTDQFADRRIWLKKSHTDLDVRTYFQCGLTDFERVRMTYGFPQYFSVKLRILFVLEC